MKKISKKALALFLSLIIAIAIVPVTGVHIKAEAATGEDVVAYARQYLGCPYVSGATGPDKFDCSGFVSFIYGHFGISLPNSTYTIWNNISSYGTVVDHGSIEKAQAGDIIVWSGHVSIYTSDGGCIEALNPRYGVTEAIKVNGHTNGMDYYVLRIPGLEGVEIKPEAPVISVDRETADKGETIKVQWKAVAGAESYRVLCKSDIINYVNSDTTDTSKTFALANAGMYNLTVTAKSKNGEAKSNQITLYIGKYTVKYNANGGTGAPASQTKYYGKEITLSSSAPIRSGYTFMGWNTHSAGTGTMYKAEAKFNENKDTTLYAVWSSDSEHIHSYRSKVTTAATCEKDGVKTFTCACGDSYTEKIPATGHTWGDWVVTKLPTTSAAGEKQHTCEKCKKVETEKTPKLTSDKLLIDKATIAMNYKGTAKLMANKTVTWSTSNAKVASVDTNGNVIATGTGTAIITATAANGSTTTCVVQSTYTWWQWIIRTIFLGFLWY